MASPRGVERAATGGKYGCRRSSEELAVLAPEEHVVGALPAGVDRSTAHLADRWPRFCSTRSVAHPRRAVVERSRRLEGPAERSSITDSG